MDRKSLITDEDGAKEYRWETGYEKTWYKDLYYSGFKFGELEYDKYLMDIIFVVV